jgi:uncharacterized protein (TIGR03437 family)
MRQIPAALLALLTSCSVFGQTYTISTFAGGALPVNILGTSASLGDTSRPPPRFIAVDRTGSALFVVQDSVLRLDAVTGILTVVAGNGSPGFSGDNGPATSSQLSNPLGIALDSVGNLYIADAGNNRIRRVSKGVITTVAGNGTQGFSGDNGPAASAQLNGAQGLAADGAGNLYIADSQNHRVRKVSNEVITTVAGNGKFGFGGDNGPATNAQLNAPYDLAVDSAGNLYIADSENGRIRKVSAGIITTIAGNGQQGFGGDNGPAANAGLTFPHGVAVDSAGNLYIAADFRIRKVSNGVITTIAGNGEYGFNGDNRPATTAAMNPFGVAVDPAGSLYIVDSTNFRIRKVSSGIITTVAGDGKTGGFSGDNGPAVSALLDRPTSIAADASGNVYIADYGNGCIRRVSNGLISTVAGGGSSLADNIPATSSRLSPISVAVDSSGNLYIADLNNRVRKVSYGMITTVAGTGTAGFSGDNGPAISAQLSSPQAVAVDSSGNLYIGDGNRVRKISGGIITTVAGNGTGGGGGDGGPASNAQLYHPEGLAVDSAGNLYIADSYNFRIRKVSNGIITTVAGNGIQGFAGDGGPATNAEMKPPEGIAIDSAGNLYIADNLNCAIRRVSNGLITTIAGNGMPGSGGDNGPANNAQLNQPFGVALDASGNVYVADTGNNRIRLLTRAPCTYTVSATSLQSPWSGGNLAISIQTTAPCLWTISGLPAWITYSGGLYGAGSATITWFVVANSGATRSATVSVAGTSVQVTQLGAPSIYPGGIVNAASSAGGSPVAAGSIATVYGAFLVDSLAIASSSPLPNELAGLSLQVAGGLSAPLFAVSSGQVNFQVPWLVAGQSRVTLSAALKGQTGPSQIMNIAAFAPGIFSMNGQGTGQGAIIDTSYRLVDSSAPAIAGSTIIQIYCTGLGAVTNRPASGSAALGDPLSYTTTVPTVMIGGAQASVLFSGLAPGSVGEYQINALVPDGSSKGSPVPVTVSIGGATSNTVTIAVQ